MLQLKLALLLFVATAAIVYAKPSHHLHQHLDLHAAPLPDHFDYVPPVLPPTHFHAPAADTLWPAATPLAPAPAPFYAAPAPLLPAPTPLLPAPETFIPAPAHLHPHAHAHPVAPAPFLPAVAAPLPLPAPAPLLPAVHTHLLPTTEVHLPPVLESIPFAPTYRVIPGPKTTTHHVSVGYAFPRFAPHAHLHAAPLKLAHNHHHHHTLF